MNTDVTDQETRKSWRMFCAFELPESLRAQIGQHVQRVRHAVPEASASWSRPENIHLTVKFLGSVDWQHVPVISAAAARVVKQFSPIQIEVGKTGVFPRPSRPQVLWIGVEDTSGALAHFHKQLENEFARRISERGSCVSAAPHNRAHSQTAQFRSVGPNSSRLPVQQCRAGVS